MNVDKTEYTVTPKQDSEVQPLKVKFGNQETNSQAMVECKLIQRSTELFCGLV